MYKPRTRDALIVLGSLVLLTARAAEVAPANEQAPAMTAAEFEASLAYQTGTVELGDGLAVLNLPDSLRYLDARNTEKLLEEGWGNPDGSGTLGMILPADPGPLQEGGWGVVVNYEDEGYVSDEDADKINYDDLLKQMKEDIATENEERAKAGYDALNLVGWAEPPRYDKANHKLHWAKEFAFANEPDHTLNYNIRILGRKGVLVLNAVSGMDQMDLIKRKMPAVINATNFKPGNGYADYKPGTDKLAAYGLAALIAGGVAAKTGLFAKLIALVLAFKKIIIGALVVLFGGIGSWFKGKKSS